MKILLVEDNLLNQKVVGFHLIKSNYEIAYATNGSEAMEKIEANPPDLILMDIVLPGENGFEITVKIRALEKSRNISKGVPIIALTANTLDNDKEKCINAGMNDYLAKPFTAEELLEVIKRFEKQE